MLGAASVNTLQIAGNAVTLPMSATATSSINMNAGWEQTLVQTPTYTSKGGQAVIMFGGILSTVPDAAPVVALRVYRNSVLLMTLSTTLDAAIFNMPPITDTPGDGASVYYLWTYQVQTTNGMTYGTIGTRTGYVLETIK